MRSAPFLWLALLITTACAGRAGRTAVPDSDLGSLLDLVPAGISYVVHAQPERLARQGAALSLWRALVSEERERALADRTGIDPLTIEELVAVELPNRGYALLLRGPFDARDVVQRGGDRLAIKDVVSDQPLTRREGLAGQGRYAYAALAQHTVLVAKDAQPAFVAEVIARRQDRRAQGAVGAADARSLRAEHAASPLVLYAPQPLELPRDSGVGALMSRERALAVSVQPTASVLPVAIDLRGEFPPGAEHNLRALAKSLASEPLGRALGLSRVPESMAIRVDQQGAYVTFALVADELLAGVRMLFFDDLRTLFGS